MRVAPTYRHGVGLRLGLWDSLEIGFDDDFEGTTTWNARVLPTEGTDGALSFGWRSIEGGRTTAFAVGRLDLRGLRLHAGWLRDGTSRPLLGLDAPLGSWTLIAEWIGGDGAAAWLGICGDVLSTRLCVTVSVGVPERLTNGVATRRLPSVLRPILDGAGCPRQAPGNAPRVSGPVALGPFSGESLGVG